MNADETKRTEEFIADDSPAEMTQPHPGEFPVAESFKCSHCRSDKFRIDTLTGNWFAICVGCGYKYELLPNGTCQFLERTR